MDEADAKPNITGTHCNEGKRETEESSLKISPSSAPSGYLPGQGTGMGVAEETMFFESEPLSEWRPSPLLRNPCTERTAPQATTRMFPRKRVSRASDWKNPADFLQQSRDFLVVCREEPLPFRGQFRSDC